jgi:hypothetical protein
VFGNNTDSQTANGIAGFSFESADFSSTQATGLASWMSYTQGDPTTLRFEVDFDDATANNTAIRDFIDNIRSGFNVACVLTWRVPGAGSDTATNVVVEGFSFSGVPGKTSYTFYFSPAFFYDTFILNSTRIRYFGYQPAWLVKEKTLWRLIRTHSFLVVLFLQQMRQTGSRVELWVTPLQTTSQTLTTTSTIATGMTVTFDAETDRLYKVTYLEPEAQTPSVVNGDTTIAIKLTDASTTALSVSAIKTPSAAKLENQMTTIAIESFASAGSKTFVGVASIFKHDRHTTTRKKRKPSSHYYC